MKPTVTIAIPAHNEQATIGGLLDAIAMQNRKGYILDKVVVLCDGCYDSTASVAQSKRSATLPIEIVEDNVRLGKIGRLNDLFQRCQTDLIVIMDADIGIKHSDTLTHLVSAFADRTIGLASGHETPFEPITFPEQIFETWATIWREIRMRVRSSDFVHNNAGCISAVHRDVYKHLVIPSSVVGEDEFMYFETKRRGLRFASVPAAKVYYRLPMHFRDYFIQSERYNDTREKIVNHFGFWTLDEYAVPLHCKLYGILKVFVDQPAMTLLALATQIALRVRSWFKSPMAEGTHLWRIAHSTKVVNGVVVYSMIEPFL